MEAAAILFHPFLNIFSFLNFIFLHSCHQIEIKTGVKLFLCYSLIPKIYREYQVLMKKLADGEKNMKHLLNAAEKQAKNVNTKNVELGDLEIIKKELDQEKSKVILAINELNVERELHSATKKELKYANLPAWTKLQKWAEEIK